MTCCCRKSSLGGLTAGALGQFIASPTDLVKVQMQMEGRRRLEGKPPR
jgi:solute carrier family 25 uncoupling protein 27